ncbi:MAG: (2E,6E)-farnesyl diphosphate synthase [Gammaproteobacteria bacterium]|jgi:farnesyl diphosphate synthase
MTNNNRDPLSGLLTSYRARVNQALEQYLPPSHIQPVTLHEAMRYAVLSGGKRIRASLVYATGSAVGAEVRVLDAPACAVELIHAYSLIHDDLPAMDDDDLRRGEPTCHRAFDEATAILAGDALQSLAFYVLSHTPPTDYPPQRMEMINHLAFASGSRGMAGGQALDLAAEGKDLNLAELENMHIHKTGALIRASVKLGMLARPEVDRSLPDPLDHYAKCIGLAFQICDDILDVEGDTEVLGKPRGSDAAHNKSTYPSLVGLAAAKQMAKELEQQAIESLQGFGEAADPLRWIARYVVARSS